MSRIHLSAYTIAMFTGIVQTMGRVEAATKNAFGVRLIVAPGDDEAWAAQPFPPEGDSIAVNGCCLTHAPKPGDALGQLAFDVIAETLDKTNLGRLSAGDAVNLERSLTASTPIAGHFVQGHVDGVGAVRDIRAAEAEHVVTIAPPAALMPYIVPKGSVAVNGVSLTIASVDTSSNAFTVALIPTTLAITTLGAAKVGDAVNLEADMIAKTVVNWLSLQFGEQGKAADAALTMDKLREAGFA